MDLLLVELAFFSYLLWEQLKTFEPEIADDEQSI